MTWVRKLTGKEVMAILRKNNVTIEKRDFEKLVKDLSKESNPSEKLEEFIKGKK